MQHLRRAVERCSMETGVRLGFTGTAWIFRTHFWVVVDDFHVNLPELSQCLNLRQPERLMRLAEADEVLHGCESAIGTRSEVVDHLNPSRQ